MSIDQFNSEKAILEEIKNPLIAERGARLFVKRDDLIHAEVSGNKWRKLKYNISKCFDESLKGVLTFGGAYSNHLVATAAACNAVGLSSIGIVRGHELNSDSNDTLKRCSLYGMKLIFVSREEYFLRNEPAYLKQLHIDFPSVHIVPEGGANYLGVIGSQQIMSEITVNIDAVFVAQGTTTTSCGIAMGLGVDQRLHVVPVLKGFDSKSEMRSLLMEYGLEELYVEDLLDDVNVLDSYHFGGYGKYTSELLSFIQDIHREYGLKLDPIYTGKAFFALMDQLRSGKLDGKDILFVHTGGLQGAKSIEEKEGIKLY